jgi:hypothetical protein
MALRKIAKKLDATGEDSNPNAYVLSDTTLGVVDTIKTWTWVFEVLEHQIINCQKTLPKKMMTLIKPSLDM